MVSIQGNVVQALELQKGHINLTNGSSVEFRTAVVHCVTDGSITITWSDGTEDTVGLVATDDVAISNATVMVESGTFHIDTL